MGVIDILVTYQKEFLLGLWVTLKLCLVIWPAGLLVGSLVGIAGTRWKLTVGVPSKILSFALSGVPILVLLFWLHYPVQSMLKVVINPFYTAAAALSLANIFGVADYMRGVLNDFPEQYVTTARICGLSRRQTVMRIQIPIVFRQVVPNLLVMQIVMLQATLFASLISVDEIFRVAQRINSQVYRPVEIYSALAVFFLLVCLPLHGLAYWLKYRFTRNLSDR